MLLEYVKRNNKKVGVVVVNYNISGLYLGYSLCRKTDTFNADIGKDIATGRMYFVNQDSLRKRIPRSIHKNVKKMLDRAKRYYKIDSKNLDIDRLMKEIT